MNKGNQILNKDHLTIIITDSGLGGLSVHAYLDKLLRDRKVKPKVDLIFYNSLVDHDYGYNSMPDKAEKVRVFNKALNGMTKFNPDIILIACNTLSVIFGETKFAKTTTIPVIGIVDLGIRYILDELGNDEKRKVIIFGTETTIASNQYKDKLIENGIESSRIINQAGKNLESEIQLNPKSDIVKSLISKFVDDAYKKIGYVETAPIAFLACTHYGYSLEIFQEILDAKFKQSIKILNPNKKMAKTLSEKLIVDRNHNTEISNKVISRVEIYEQEKKSLGKLLKKDSLYVADALINYELNINLFNV